MAGLILYSIAEPAFTKKSQVNGDLAHCDGPGRLEWIPL